MTRLSVRELKGRTRATLRQVAVEGKRVVVCDGAVELAVLMPIRDLKRLERLQRKEREDRLDLITARKALREAGPNIPLEAVKDRLGL